MFIFYSEWTENPAARAAINNRLSKQIKFLSRGCSLDHTSAAQLHCICGTNLVAPARVLGQFPEAFHWQNFPPPQPEVGKKAATQHNEHRMVFPRLLMLALTSFSRWNILYQLYSSWILIVFTWFILWDPS